MLFDLANAKKIAAPQLAEPRRYVTDVIAPAPMTVCHRGPRGDATDVVERIEAAITALTAGKAVG